MPLLHFRSSIVQMTFQQTKISKKITLHFTIIEYHAFSLRTLFVWLFFISLKDKTIYQCVISFIMSLIIFSWLFIITCTIANRVFVIYEPFEKFDPLLDSGQASSFQCLQHIYNHYHIVPYKWKYLQSHGFSNSLVT